MLQCSWGKIQTQLFFLFCLSFLRSPQPLQHAASRRTSECKRKQGRLGRGYTPTVLIETGVTNETTGIKKR